MCHISVCWRKLHFAVKHWVFFECHYYEFHSVLLCCMCSFISLLLFVIWWSGAAKWFSSRQPNHHHHHRNHHHRYLCLFLPPLTLSLNSPPAKLPSHTFSVSSVLTHTPLFSYVCSSWYLCCWGLCVREQLVVQWVFGVFGECSRAAMPVFYVCFVKYTSVSAVRAHKEQKDWLMEIVREWKNVYCLILLFCVWMLFSNVSHCGQRLHIVCVRLFNHTFQLSIKYLNIKSINL